MHIDFLQVNIINKVLALLLKQEITPIWKKDKHFLGISLQKSMQSKLEEIFDEYQIFPFSF